MRLRAAQGLQRLLRLHSGASPRLASRSSSLGVEAGELADVDVGAGDLTKHINGSVKKSAGVLGAEHLQLSTRLLAAQSRRA